MINLRTKKFGGKILALDTASKKTGYAIYKNGKIFKSGTWRLKKDKEFSTLFDNLKITVEKYGITLIVAEGIYQDKNKKDAYEKLCMCKGVINVITEHYDIPLTTNFNPIRIKQHIWNYNPYSETHKKLTRTEHKERMINAVTRLGYNLETDEADDEADAIGLLITYVDSYRYEINHPAKSH